MRLFDLHCDTISECCNQSKELYENDLHISLKRASTLEKYIQVFAIFIPDEYRGKSATDYFEKVYAYYLQELEKNSNILLCEDAKIKTVLSVEGGAAIAGNIENLHHINSCGVRLMTLTWNGKNEIGNGCFSEDESGLTDFGKETVKEMEKLGMTVDVSHLNKAGFFDVAKISEKPFIASHSNADLADNMYGKARNLTDEQIKIIIDFGGLMGINFVRDFLGFKDETMCEAIYRHMAKVLDMGGEKILAIGGDYDGCEVEDELRGIEKMGLLYEYLRNRGIDEQTLNNIFYKNAARFFGK